MKITGLETHLLCADIPEEYQVYSGAGRKTVREAALVTLETDEGVTGVGAVGTGSTRMLHAISTLVDDLFAPQLIGRDPAPTESLWDELYYGTVLRQTGPQSLGIEVLSGVDMALWDIKAKAAGVPLAELLGGSTEPVPVYASGVYEADVDEAVRTARRFVDAGYTAMKVKIGFLGFEAEMGRLEAIRRAVPDAELSADANMGYTYHAALRVGRELDKMGFSFFEEPIPIHDVDGYAELSRKLDLRVALGENLLTRYAFVPFLQRRAIGLAQPETSKSGGITETCRIVDTASSFSVEAAPHSLGNAITLAAAAHITAARPACVTLECEELHNPMTERLIRERLRVEGGKLLLPSAPGLGVDVDWDWAEDHRYRGGGPSMTGSTPMSGLRGGR